MQLSREEISYYQEQLEGCEIALRALAIIEDCEGDLEDSATDIALSIGQTPDRVDWLEGLVKRCRVAICEQDLREDLQDNYIEPAVQYLLERKICPPLLVTPVVIYAVKQGIDRFCEPLTYHLSMEK
ncbi:hypothetical protein IQ215_12525 [Cyanobacterium stanieri LEGE 03274]|uniref:Uncharacterized protein n=2 Tax=Cyanobacterium TaxID=102234 RepID=A0ABR9V6K8_9CHRO|nr:hypothetical protein [Cyanobacterium stanieri LEGE 03274]